jgi:hypothetical protein
LTRSIAIHFGSIGAGVQSSSAIGSTSEAIQNRCHLFHAIAHVETENSRKSLPSWTCRCRNNRTNKKDRLTMTTDLKSIGFGKREGANCCSVNVGSTVLTYSTTERRQPGLLWTSGCTGARVTARYLPHVGHKSGNGFGLGGSKHPLRAAPRSQACALGDQSHRPRGNARSMPRSFANDTRAIIVAPLLAGPKSRNVNDKHHVKTPVRSGMYATSRHRTRSPPPR